MTIRLKQRGKAVLGTQTVTAVDIDRDGEIIGTAYRQRDGLYLFNDDRMSRSRLLALLGTKG